MRHYWKVSGHQCLPNFVQIGPRKVELWRHSDFQDGGRGIALVLRVSFLLLHSSRKVEIYMPTKFRRDISIHGLGITAFRFWKHPPCWNSTSGFDFCTFASQSACRSASAYQISSKSDHLWQSYLVISSFQDGGRQPYWTFSRVTAYHPRSANECLRWLLKFRLDRIYSFGDIILLFLCCEVLAWNCLYTWFCPPRMRRIKGLSTSEVKTNHIFWFVGVDLPIQHLASIKA